MEPVTVHHAPRSEQPEGLSRAWIIGTLLGVILFSTLLSIVAGMMLGRWRHALEPSARMVAQQPRIAAQVSHVHAELFSQADRAAGPRSRAQQLAHLQRYGWVDHAHGIVHLPIDVAIEVLLDRQHGSQE